MCTSAVRRQDPPRPQPDRLPGRLAIQPFHGPSDGDVLFAATTNEIDNPRASSPLAVVASELAWDAVLASYEK